MDVQKTNFSEAFEIFKSALLESEAVALDLEFTGIRGKPETFIDSCEERYSSLRRIASTFRIIQVGLSLFSSSGGSWVARPFNFYVFPSEVPGYNQRLVLEIGAINFLKEHRMDFNTWLYNGIPYLNEAQAKDLESRLIETTENEQEDIVLTKNYEQVKMSEVTFRIERWLESHEDRMEITGLNAYLRKYLYGFVKKRYKGVFMSSNKTEGSRDVTLVLKKANERELLELEAKRIAEKTELFNEKIGFRRIFALLVERKLPLIVHNGMIDILFTISAFQEDLPEKYQDFKTLVHRLFPSIYDTRFMLEHIPGFFEEFDKVTSLKGLKELYSFLKSQNPPVLLSDSFSKYNDESFAHEAGFDAYMTGVCFLKLSFSKIDLPSYLNRLPLYKSFFSVNLQGEDALYSDNSYYLKGSDLKHFFSGNEGFSYKYVKDDECFLKPLTSEKQSELDKLVSSHNLTCMSVEEFFKKKG
jgi:poly(A)-specific ribonuclease